MQTMDKEDFKARFQSVIRVRMDWHAFDSPEVVVQREQLALPRQLDRLWTPWYVGGTDGPPPQTPEAEPLSVNEAARDVERLGHNGPGVHRHVQEGDARDYEAPALQMADGRFLLLDRNHHTVAAAILGSAVTVTLAVVRPTGGRRMLLDLPF